MAKVSLFVKHHLVVHLDRVIAWLNEVATVAHNNTSRRLGKKITELLPQS